MDLSKRLYRSRTNKTLGGVCGGLGDYFSIDPILFRLAFILLVLLAGTGVLAYLILWLVVPEEQMS